MVTGSGTPRFVLHRHGRYVRTAMVWPVGTHNYAEVSVVETERLGQALRLCTGRHARRLACLINLHEPLAHMRWEVVSL